MSDTVQQRLAQKLADKFAVVPVSSKVEERIWIPPADSTIICHFTNKQKTRELAHWFAWLNRIQGDLASVTEICQELGLEFQTVYQGLKKTLKKAGFRESLGQAEALFRVRDLHWIANAVAEGAKSRLNPSGENSKKAVKREKNQPTIFLASR